MSVKQGNFLELFSGPGYESIYGICYSKLANTHLIPQTQVQEIHHFLITQINFNFRFPFCQKYHLIIYLRDLHTPFSRVMTFICQQILLLLLVVIRDIKSQCWGQGVQLQCYQFTPASDEIPSIWFFFNLSVHYGFR